MLTTRRTWLQTTLGSATLLAGGTTVPGFVARTAAATGAAPQRGGNVLVVIQLTGGNDGLNTVIPYADDGYARHRLSLRIPEPQVLRLDDHVGLHPRLRAAHELYQRGWLSIVQGVGYPNPNRSHFRSMDIWHTAQPEVESAREGWLGRALDWQTARQPAAGRDVPALHVGGEVLPLALAARTTAVPSIQSIDRMRLNYAGGAAARRQLHELAAMPRAGASDLLQFVSRSTLTAYVASDRVTAAAGNGQLAAEWPNHGLARKLQPIAQLIDSGLDTQVYYVSLDGFDTHANQAAAHANLLAEWAESLAAFLDELHARGHDQRVCVLTFSEFGRRVKENASQGTDHGTAAPVFVAGGRVAGGLVGQHPSLNDLDQGDLKYHTDFRSVYAALLEGWLGVAAVDVLGTTWQPAAVLS